ncbi:LOW QUALITY PROTEIN: hypothetical protein Cgig2_022535 [Carnegiea gigantea]|uniref:Uncharacterized protein n=1 Tax=Carnegiea gigantea TaxID=171969 RepID=A0A9Q1JN66_9CARY|nr:LOW QUALITY PROTEIN: hypothetical protein Cgig2_022535 [Carnegiea gigantea]
MEINSNPMPRRPRPIETPAKFKNKNKFYHEDNGHTTSECYELNGALHELANQGQLNRFLRRGEGGDCNRRDSKGKKDSDANCNAEIIETIIGGIDDRELNAGYRKAEIQKLSEVMATRELKPLVGLTITFGPEDMRPLQTPHKDALVIQIKIGTAMVR